MSGTSLLAMLPLCAALLAGCEADSAPPAASQIAARVDSDVIRVQDVNAARGAGTRREALDRLIDQQLALRRALEQRLDREPAVLRALEACKGEILAHEHLQQVAQVTPRPSPQEVRAYYAAHPELFAQRRLYTLEEIEVTSEVGIEAALRERAAAASSLEEIADWLRLRGVPHTYARGVRAAERVPLDFLTRLHAAPQGEIRLYDAGGERLLLIRVLGVQTAPLEETAAAPLIEQFLLEERRKAAIGSELARLRLAARIEYLEASK